MSVCKVVIQFRPTVVDAILGHPGRGILEMLINTDMAPTFADRPVAEEGLRILGCDFSPPSGQRFKLPKLPRLDFCFPIPVDAVAHMFAPCSKCFFAPRPACDRDATIRPDMVATPGLPDFPHSDLAEGASGCFG